MERLSKTNEVYKQRIDPIPTGQAAERPKVGKPPSTAKSWITYLQSKAGQNPDCKTRQYKEDMKFLRWAYLHGIPLTDHPQSFEEELLKQTITKYQIVA